MSKDFYIMSIQLKYYIFMLSSLYLGYFLRVLHIYLFSSIIYFYLECEYRYYIFFELIWNSWLSGMDGNSVWKRGSLGTISYLYDSPAYNDKPKLYVTFDKDVWRTLLHHHQQQRIFNTQLCWHKLHQIE